MSHSTIQYVKPPAKIGTPGSARTLATARTAPTAGKPVTAGPPATACVGAQDFIMKAHDFIYTSVT
jgi:hypothetical protein